MRHWVAQLNTRFGPPLLLFAVLLSLFIAAGCARNRVDKPAAIENYLGDIVSTNEARLLVIQHADEVIEKTTDPEDKRILLRRREALSRLLDDFLARCKEDDELRTWRRPDNDRGSGGKWGLVLIRDGKIISRLQILGFE